MTNVKKLSENLVKQFEARAESEREGGASIEINHIADYIALTMSNGDEYMFQGHEMADLLDTVPMQINAADYILATAQNW